jgi:hypothetical protein
LATDKLTIYNHALVRIGEDRLATITDDNDHRRQLDAIYPQVLEEVTVNGPEGGWKFATRTYHGIDRESFTITSIAESSTSGDITVTATHALVVGDEVELDDDTGYDDTYDVTAISTTTTFDVTATWAATGTGTAYWTSQEYSYRYAKPTCLAVIKVSVGGIELTDWTEQGLFILTNEESSEVDMKIIQSVTTTTLFPTWFTKALWFKLAIEAAYSIKQDYELGDKLKLEYEEKILPKAIAMDERGKYVKESSTSWIDAGNNATEME